MKRFWILFLIFILIISATLFFGVRIKNMPQKLSDGRIVYDFSKQYQKRASKILYDYILEDLKENPQVIDDLNGSKISAFEFDLNDDGVNEIIGTVDSIYYAPANRKVIFILQKQNNGKYQNVVKYPIYFTSPSVNILPQKTDGAHKIILSTDFLEPAKMVTVEFHNGFYYTIEDYTKLKDIIENNNYFKKKPFFNILKNEKKQANKILYNYILTKDIKMSAEKAKSFANIYYNDVHATETDLNHDGENEIIGFIWSPYYMGKNYPLLFILEKKNGNYYNIGEFLDFNPDENIYIIKNNHEKYPDLILFRYGKPYYAKYGYFDFCNDTKGCYIKY